MLLHPKIEKAEETSENQAEAADTTKDEQKPAATENTAATEGAKK